MSSYGASETGIMTLDTAPIGAAHVGRPLPGKAVWLSKVGSDGVGTVTTAGPDCRHVLFDGSRVSRPDGAVPGPDLGHFDEDGNLYLDGRLDEGEKLHGRLVYPRAIERHILMLPAVEDVSVKVLSGSGHEPDRLLARVIGSVSEQEVHEHCAQLDDFRRPAIVEILPDQVGTYSQRGKL